MIIKNSKVKLELHLDENKNVENLQVFGNEKETFFTLGNDLGFFHGKVKRSGDVKFGIPFQFQSKTEDSDSRSLHFLSNHENFEIKLTIELKNTEYIYFHSEIKIKKKIKTNFLRFDVQYPFKEPLDFVKVPHTRTEKYYVMADHKLGTPAIILSKDKKSMALIADVANIPENRKFKMHMDMNHLDDRRMSYGFRDWKTIEHVMFKSKPRYKLKFDPKIQEKFELTLMIRIGIYESKELLLRDVSRFLWNYFGKLKMKDILPQTLPFEQFSTYSFDRLTDPNKYDFWREFEYEGKQCGGLISRAGTGKSRGKFISVTPDDVENYIKHPTYEHWYIKFAFFTLFNLSWHDNWILHFIAKGIQKRITENYECFWNQAWFLNVRTAYSLRSLGEMLNNEEYCEKANKILNSAITTPMKGGYFPSITIFTTEGIRFIEGVTAFVPHHEYNTVDMALTGYWMLTYAEKFDYYKDEIVNKLKLVGNDLLKLQLDSGAFPTIIKVNENDDGTVSTIPQKDLLYETPGSSAIGMFLCKLYKTTNDSKYLEAAKRIIPYLEKDVLPINKWYDYETFFSCTMHGHRFSESEFLDKYTLSLPQNTMCIYWTTDFLRELFEITRDEKHLNLGAYVLDYLSMFQQLFNAHFLQFQGFGGFCSQNNDAEWSDTRQALFSHELLKYYAHTGEEMYLERAIAALKASFVLLTHEKNKKVAPGNYMYITEDDYGALFENYAHCGCDHAVQGVVTIDWSWGTSTLAFMTLREQCGDLFIDKDKAYGINGCAVQDIKKENTSLNITLDVLPEKKSLLIKFKPSKSQINKIKLKINNKEVEISNLTDQVLELP